jgi:hypothetical protein
LNRFAAIAVVFLGCLLVTPDLLAQYETEKEATIPLEHFYIKRQGPGLRKFLSKFTFGLSTGYGKTTFKHDIAGLSLRQPVSGSPAIFIPSGTDGYSNWFNKVTPTTLPAGTTFNSTEEEIGFKSKAFHIPLRATLHFEFQRFRIGGGYSFEYTHIGQFEPITNTDVIQNFAHDANSFFLKKYFGLLGASVYRYEEYLLVVEANVGGYKLGKKFDMASIDKSLFFNLGVAVEREMSEYFRLFIRPSYDFKSFSTAVEGASIRHRFNSFYINVGATYRIPELRRCFLKQCHAQLNHAHGNREYRSRVHPIYKKQNPHYGENYPTLIKYKGKNKKKLNPY